MPKIKRIISFQLSFSHFNVRNAKTLPSGQLQRKEAIIVVYIAITSYGENVQIKFSIFVKNTLNKYDYPIPLILLLSFP